MLFGKGVDSLRDYTKKELIETYHKLNNWEWDDRLGSKPPLYDLLPNYGSHGNEDIRNGFTKYNILKPYMEYIEKAVDKKALLRLNNCLHAVEDVVYYI